jgi:hypothetical protein
VSRMPRAKHGTPIRTAVMVPSRTTGRERSWNKGWRILPSGSGGFTLAKKSALFHGRVFSVVDQFPIGAAGCNR